MEFQGNANLSREELKKIKQDKKKQQQEKRKQQQENRKPQQENRKPQQNPLLAFKYPPEATPLELLLCSPFFWTNSKVISFLNNCHEAIDQQESSEYGTLKRQINRDAKNFQIWPTNTKWQEKINDDQFTILTTFICLRNNERTVQTIAVQNTVLSLLKIIRDKFVHRVELSYSQKEIFAVNREWFDKDENEFKFNERSFVKYWNSKYPKLLPFMWEYFKSVKDINGYQSFYPSVLSTLNQTQLPLYENNLYIHADSFATQLDQAIHDYLDKGRLEERYKEGKRDSDHPEKSLEFIFLDGELLQNVLGTRRTLQIEITDDIRVLMNGYEVFAEREELRRPLTKARFVGKMFIATNVSDIDISGITGYSGGRAIIFLNGDSPQDTKDKEVKELIYKLNNDNDVMFWPKPVEWTEVSEATRKNKTINGKFIIQGKHSGVNIGQMITGNINSTLSMLDGKQLNGLLSSDSVEIFTKHKIPAKCIGYINRKCYNGSILNPLLFRQELRDIYVVVGTSISELLGALNMRKFKVAAEEIEQIIELQSNHIPKFGGKIICVKTYIPDDGVPTLKRKSRNVYFLRPMRNGRFKWFSTQGNKPTDENCALVKAAKSEGLVNLETDLVFEDINVLDGERIVFISDMAGMGKSFTLIELAHAILQTEKSFVAVVLHFTVDKFLAIFDQQKTKTEKISVVIGNTLFKIFCDTKFEEYLFFEAFLSKKANRDKTRVEIMMDGLDEVAEEKRQLTFKLLKTIQESFPVIRVWVTARSDMQMEIQKNFGWAGLKLEPMSYDEQVTLLVNHFQRYWKQQNQRKTCPDYNYFEGFAKDCLRITSYSDVDIAGIPLQCKMLAEINEESALHVPEILALGYQDLGDLYNKFVERIFIRYLKDKKGWNNASLDDNYVTKLFEEMKREHTYLALNLLYNKAIADRYAPMLYISEDVGLDSLAKVTIHQGLVQSFNPLSFYHRTYAEYFVALFIFQSITPSLTLGDITHTLNFSTVKNGNRIRELFFNIVFPINSADKSSVEQQNSVGQFLNMLFQQVFTADDEFYEALADTAPWLQYSLGCCKSLCPEVTRFFWASAHCFRNIMMLLVASNDQFNKFCMLSIQHSQIDFLKYLAKRNRGFTKQLLNNLQNLVFEENNYGLIHLTVAGFLKDLSYKSFDTIPGLHGDPKCCIKFIHGFSPEMLEVQDINGQTPYEMLYAGLFDPHYNNPYRMELIELITFLSKLKG